MSSKLIAYGVPERVWIDETGNWHRQAQLPDGSIVDQEGAEALANAANNEYATRWQEDNPELADRYRQHNRSIFYNVAKDLGAGSDKTSIGKFFDSIGASSPAAEAGTLGLVTGGIGALGGYLSDAFLDTNIGSLIPGLALGGIGAFAGYNRGKRTQKEIEGIINARNMQRQNIEQNEAARQATQATGGTATLEKSSAMYKNPRNFILEKLSAAKGISMADRVKFAIAIQELKEEEAEELKALVREETNFEKIPDVIKQYFEGETEQELPVEDAAFQLGALLTMASSINDLPEKQAAVTQEQKLALVKTMGLALSMADMEKEASIHRDIISGVETDQDVIDGAAWEAAQLLGNTIMEKRAANVIEAAINFLNSSKDALMLCSVLGGAGIGSLAWKINRDSLDGSDDADAKRAQAKYYKELANDMNKVLKAKAIRDAKAEVSSALEEKKRKENSIKETINEVANPNFIL